MKATQLLRLRLHRSQLLTQIENIRTTTDEHCPHSSIKLNSVLDKLQKIQLQITALENQ